MGYQTEFMVLNDAAGQIKKHPDQFIEAVCSACNDSAFRDEQKRKGLEFRPDECDFPLGNHCNPLIALSPHHADERRVIISGFNSFSNVSAYSRSYVRTSTRFPGILDSDIMLLEQRVRELKLLKQKLQKQP